MSLQKTATILAAMLCLAGVRDLHATSYTWTNTSSANWADSGNWTPPGVPGAADMATIATGTPTITSGLTCGTVNLSGGTLNAAANLTVKTALNWQGGVIEGEVTIQPGASMTLSNGAGVLTFVGATLVNNGTAVWSAGDISGGTDSTIANNGAWMISLPPGEEGATLAEVFDNGGAVIVNSNAVQFGGGGNYGGTFLATNGGGINFMGGGLLAGEFTAGPASSVVVERGSFTNDKAVFNGPGQTYMNNGVLLLTNDVSQNLLLAGGTIILGPQFQGGVITNLTLSGALLGGTNTVTGTLNWLGGEIDGVLTVSDTGTINLSGSEDVYQYAALTNAGQIVWNGAGDWHVNNNGGTNGGWIVNLATGVIDAQCDQKILADYGGEWMDNLGHFQKSAGTNGTSVNVLFTNAGAVKVLSGTLNFMGGSFGGSFDAANGTTLNLNNGGILSGTFNAGYGAVISLAAGVFSPTATLSFGGAGLCQQLGGVLTLASELIPNLQLNGGTIDLGAAFQGGAISSLTLSNSILTGTNSVSGTLTLQGNGNNVLGPLTVASNAVLNVNGGILGGALTVAAGATVNWNGSANMEAGVNIASNAVFNIDGDFYLENTMTNAGTVNWNGGYFQVLYRFGIYNLAGAVFNVNAPNATLNDYYGTEFFNNAGLLEKSAANNSVFFDLVLTNTGTVQALGGYLDFYGGGLLDGTNSAGPNATIELAGGAFSVGPAVAFGGAGVNTLNGYSADITLVSNVIPNLLLQDGTVYLSPTFQLNGAITNLTLDGANLGSLPGMPVVLTGVLTANSGAIDPGSFVMGPNATLNLNGTSLDLALMVPSAAVLNFMGPNTAIIESVTNAGTINWLGGDIALNNGASLNNLAGATFNVETASEMYDYYGSGQAFNNSGMFLVTNTVDTTWIDVPFNNLARVVAASGTLSFGSAGGNNFGGTFQADPGATIDFADGGYLSGTYTAVVGGTISLTGGLFSNSPAMLFTGRGSNLLNGGTIPVTTNLIPHLQYIGGQILTGPSFQDNGAITNLSLNGAGLAGANIVTGTLTLNGGAISGPLTIASNGVLNLTGPNELVLDDALTNAGTINWLGGDIYLDSTNNFDNLPGALFSIQCNQSLDSYYYYYYYYTYNALVNGGTIEKSGSTNTTYLYPMLRNSGTVQVDSGTLASYGGGNPAGLYLTRPGAEYALEGGSYSNTPAVPLFNGEGTYALEGGSLYLFSNTIPNLLLNYGDVYLEPGFQGGSITNLSLGDVYLEGSNAVTGVLDIGDGGYVEGALTLAAGSSVNSSGAYFESPVTVSAGAVLNCESNYAQFDNLLTNQGTINWTGGTLYFYNTAYNQAGAVFNIQCDQALYGYYYDYSTLYNSGLIRKTITTGPTYVYNCYIENVGTVDVESGLLDFGSYAGLSGGAWDVGIGGTANYGSFGFSGSMTPGGALTINALNGFLFSPGNVFALATYQSETGQFASTNVQPPQGASYSLTYGPSALTFTIDSLSAPLVSISSPSNFQAFTVGGTVPVTVNLPDANAAVTNLQFYQGASLIGSANSGLSSPYTFRWTGVANGYYTLTAKATDSAGAVGVSPPVAISVYSNATGNNYTWTGAISTNWATAANWSPAHVPGASDNAVINGGPPVNLDTGTTVNNVVLSAGALTGGGPLAVAGGFNWTGGAISVPLTIGGGGTLYIDGASPLGLSNATLVNLGTIEWLGGDIYANAATVISNRGNWIIRTDNDLTNAGGFINSGTFTKLAGPGTNWLYNIPFTNSGAIDIASGTVVLGGGYFGGTVLATNTGTIGLAGGGDLNGSFIAAAPGGIFLVRGAFNYDTNADFEGSGISSFSGDTLTLSNNVSPNLLLAGGGLYLGPAFQNGGAISNLTLSGTTLFGTNTVTGLLNWASGGYLGGGQLTIARKGVLEFSGPQEKILTNSLLINNGTVNWTGGHISAIDSIITNNRQWNIVSDDSWAGISTTFVNNGTLEKYDSTNATVIDVQNFSNNGVVDAETGTLTIQADGTLGGTFDAAPGAALDFGSDVFGLGAVTLGQLPVFGGGGTIRFISGTLVIQSNVPPGIDGLTGGKVVLGPNFQSNGVITNLTLDGAILSGSYTVAGTFNWLNGGISGSLTVASNATLAINSIGNVFLDSGAITNFGTVLWTNGEIYALAGTFFVNNGLWLAQSDNDMYAYSGAATFINNSTFRKSGTTGGTYFNDLSFVNAGLVDVESGAVYFNGGGVVGDTYSTTPQTAVYFDGGDFTLAGVPSFTGGGTVEMAGGAITLVSNQIPGLPLTGGTVALGPAFQNNGAITNLTLDGATLAGPAAVTGTLNWLAGYISGPLTVESNAILNISLDPNNDLHDLTSGALTNLGSVFWSGGDIYGDGGALYVNNGLWLAQSNNTLGNYYYYDNPASFLNNGVFRKSGATGSTYVDMPFTNNGGVDVQSGSLVYEDGGGVGGAYNTAANAAIYLDGGDFTNAGPATFAGAGLSEFDGGYDTYLTLLSDQIPTLPLVSGYLKLGPAFQNKGAITNLTLTGATLVGSNTVTGTLNWSAGGLSGVLTIAPNGTLQISGPGEKYLYDLDEYNYPASVVNAGTVDWSGGYIYGLYYSYSTVTNTGLWLDQTDGQIEYVAFYNSGTFQKSGASGQTVFYSVPFINSGTLDVESGLVVFNDVSNYEQTVATLSFGVSAANLPGQLSVAGPVNLDGTLAVHFLNGYTPIAGDNIQLMTYGSEAGSFASFNLPPLPGGLNWQPQVSAGGISLRVVPALAPVNTLTLSGSVTSTRGHPIPGVTVFATIGSATASNLIQNGSFETPSIGYNAFVLYPTGSTNITGWTVTGPPGTAVDITSQYWISGDYAEDGTQYLDPTGNYTGQDLGGITQTFPTVQGTTYDLIFYHGTQSRYYINSALGVAIGTNYYTFGETSGGVNGLDWREVVIPFIAPSNFTTLTFTSLTGANTDNIFVDNVQVVTPDYGRVLEAVTDSTGNYTISLANNTFQVGVGGLQAAGYNPLPVQSVPMNGNNQVANFTATPLSEGAISTVTTSVNPANAGTATGGGAYTDGTTVTVVAQATNEIIPYLFANWTENGVVVSTSIDYAFTVTGNASLVANFKLPAFEVAASANPPTAGYVTGAGSAVWGATNTLFATAYYGYGFDNWTIGKRIVSTNPVLATIVYSNINFTANFVATNVLHVVTVATSPAGVATLTGAGTYDNGQTAIIKAPYVVTNLPDYYTFQYLLLNGSVVTYSTNYSLTFSTLYPHSNQFTAVYTVQSAVPTLVAVHASYGNPVPKTTNFILALVFDRTMNTKVPPTVVLSNTAATEPAVGSNGQWSATSYADDTYSTPPISFGPGMDGTVLVEVSGAQDTAGHKMAPTNALTLTVRSTPPVVTISAPANGASFTTTNTIAFSAGASSPYGIESILLYTNGIYLGVQSASNATNVSTSLTGLNSGSYKLTAVATDLNGLAATSAPAHITVNVPGTTLIDFEAVDASSGPVAGATLSSYLANYGVTLTNVTTNTTVAVQDDQNILGGKVTVASSGDNLLTQIGANGTVSYTLVFSQTYQGVSWTRTELLAGSGGIETPSWQATAYDANGTELASVGEKQFGSFTNIPAHRFSLAGAGIKSVTFAGNNSFGALNTLPLDDLLLESAAPASAIAISLTNTASILSAPGSMTLTATASEPDGQISRIDFYEGQNYLGSAVAPALGSLTNASLRLANLAAGTYTFTAVATDNSDAVRSSDALNVTVAATANVQVINFDTLDTSAGAVGGTQLSNYLAVPFGVSITNATLGTRLEAVNGNNLSGNAIAVPSSPPNLFTQVGLNQPVTFTLKFATPVQSIGFTRVALTAGPAGISHPAWTAHAFNAAGAEVESVTEPLLFSLTNLPARIFQLVGTNITRVRFDSDSRQTASFSAVLLDDLVLDGNATTNPLSITLNPPASLQAPANIPLTANVSDSLGSVAYINFYAGPNLIGTASGGATSIVWNDVLAGSYTVTAQLFDSSGYAISSAPVTVTVTHGTSNSKLVNFDSLNTATAPVTGTALTTYLATNGMTLTNISAGTKLAVENQSLLNGGGFVAASSPPNVLTQIGSNGPVSFTLSFSPLLTNFAFTRPQLLANPFVTHPAWQVEAYDLLGVPLAQAQEGLISTYTNVAAQTYVLNGNGAGIATIQFNSQGTALTTFNAMLLDDFVLTPSLTNLPPAVLLTNPMAGQVYTAPALIPLGAVAVDPSVTITSVSFYTNGGLAGSAAASPFSLLLTNVPVGSYTLTAVAADRSGLSRTSPPVAITVNPQPTVFGILTQPVGQTVPVGSSMVFDVTTTGTNGVTYQWTLNGANLPGQDLPVLSIFPVGANDAGTYTVTVTSEGQSLTSQGAVLTVLYPPGIAVPPQSQEVVIGSNVVLSVALTPVSSGPFTYQWILNGTGIAGATDSSHTIATAQPLDSGNYQVVVGNAVGFTSSPIAAVSVTVAGGLSQSADNFSNRISINPLVGPVFGNNASATKEPGEPDFDGKPGGKSIWYTWHASFTGVVSLTTRGSSFDTLLAVYTGTNFDDFQVVAQDDDSGGFFTSLVTFNCVAGVDYQIGVDGFQGASGNVVLGLPAGTGYRVLNPASGDSIPAITNTPASQVVPAGSNVTLSVGAASVSPMTYQWFFQNAPISGANGGKLVISNFQAGAVGNYYVLVANAVGSVQSVPASIQIAARNQNGAPANSAHDKFGDAVDLSKTGSSPMLSRPEDGGGDTRGFTVSQTFSTVGATKEAGEPNPAGQAGGASEWYIYTAAIGGTLHVDTIGSTFNTVLGVYTNSSSGAASFSTLAAAPNWSGFTTNYQTQGQPSLNLSNVLAGTVFYIVVDGYNGASGMARLNIGLGAPPTILTQPQSRPTTPGGGASFSVAVVGTTNFYYQWQFDGGNIARATNSSYSLTNAQRTAVGSYVVIVSNAITTVTSAPAVLTLQSSPFIVAGPTNETVPLGNRAGFSVTAGGSNTLFYQWYFDGGKIAKATATSYTIASAQYANAGTYTVVVSNSLGAASNSAVLNVTESTRPVVAILSPSGNYSTNNPSLVVHGTAHDQRGVTGIGLLLNSNAVPGVTGTTNWTNWSAAITLVPGPNYITANSTNAADLVSLPVTRTITYIVTSPLTLVPNGPGRITGETNKAILKIGTNYTVTATASNNCLFSNWMILDPAKAPAESTTPILKFTMATNLVLEANFVTNPFPAIAGSFNGLFYQTNGSPVTEQSSGFVTVTIASTSKGAYTAKLLLDGGSYSFTGAFDLNGNSVTNLTRRGKSPLTVTLHVDLNTLPPATVMTGTVAATNWAGPSGLMADLAVFNGKTIVASNYAGKYTLVLPGSTTPATSPGGYGAATFTNNLAGTAVLGGALGDGTSLGSQSAPISQDGLVPVYIPLYSGQGSVFGWLAFSNLPPKTVSGDLTWFKLSGPAKSLYSNGFAIQTNIIGSVYVPSATNILALTNGTLTITDPGQGIDLVYTNVTVASNKLTYTAPPTNQLIVTFTPASGTMTVSFRPTGAKANITAQGVLLQDALADPSLKAAGWFIGANQTGYFILTH
ncbi:MAG: Ig-like domain-containing protein [Verrucomicrobiota bacterium]|jgi:hypothetical protein